MSIFIDTSYLIGYYNKEDKHHQKAIGLSGIFSGKEFGTVYISDYIFTEAMNYLITRIKSRGLAIELAGYIFNSEMEIIYMDKNIFQKSWELFKQRKNLSFTDCTTIELMKAYGIKSIATFDSGFGQFGKEIKILR